MRARGYPNEEEDRAETIQIAHVAALPAPESRRRHEARAALRDHGPRDAGCRMHRAGSGAAHLAREHQRIPAPAADPLTRECRSRHCNEVPAPPTSGPWGAEPRERCRRGAVRSHSATPPATVRNSGCGRTMSVVNAAYHHSGARASSLRRRCSHSNSIRPRARTPILIGTHRLCEGLDRRPEPRCPDRGAQGGTVLHDPHRDRRRRHPCKTIWPTHTHEPTLGPIDHHTLRPACNRAIHIRVSFGTQPQSTRKWAHTDRLGHVAEPRLPPARRSIRLPCQSASSGFRARSPSSSRCGTPYR